MYNNTNFQNKNRDNNNLVPLEFISANRPTVNSSNDPMKYCNSEYKNDNNIILKHPDNNSINVGKFFPDNIRNRDAGINPLDYFSPRLPNPRFELDGLPKSKFCEPDLSKIQVNDYNDYVKNETSLGTKFLTNKEYCKPEFLHNNVKDKAIDILTEFTIVIDSSDRDITKYPNPFQYRVFFNPVSGTKDAYIFRTFENVKYIKLETAVLPRKYYFTRRVINISSENINSIKNTTSGNVTLTGSLNGTFNIIENYTDTTNNHIVTFAQITDYPNLVTSNYELINDTLYTYELSTISLETEKYLLLNIDEFSDVNDMATNQIINRSFSIMFPDYVNGDNYYTDTHFVDKIFKFSDLGNIKSFTINISDYMGNVYKNCINNNWIDSHINTPATCICKPDANGFVVRNYGCACSYMRHPLHIKFQNTLLFKIGVVETDIDKTIFT